MLRRVFLLQILLGWLIAVMEKLKGGIMSQPAATASLFPHILPINLYVDSLNGDDRQSGRQESSDGRGDGALATLKRAKAIARELSSLQPNRPINIILRGGTHFLAQPLIFTPEDSGKTNSPITYQSYPREQATISGGKLITGWRRETVNGIKMWTANLPQDESKWQFQHLWVNGTKRSRSRYPSQGYLKIRKSHSKKGQKWTEGNSLLEYYPGDLPDRQIEAFKNAELVVMTRWVESHLPITKIEPIKRLVHFSKVSVLKLYAGDLFYLENALEWLDTPGEWYLDRQQGKLYYLPLPEEDLATVEVIAPVLDTLLEFRGDAASNQPVKHLKFKNLTFSHTDWHLPKYISGYNQNAWQVPAAVRAITLNYTTWTHCTFAHLGNHGLHLGADCQYNRISYCSFFDLAGGGIKIGHKQYLKEAAKAGRGNHHNLIVRNHLYDGGKFFHSASAIVLNRSHHNFIARNHIHDFYYTGISIMGTWSFRQTQAHHNLIQDNHIHHIGKLSSGDGPIISDMGGVYILGTQRGTKVQHNRIHDINALRYGGWGIYLDEGSSYILAEHNLVYRTSHGGFAQHYGKENIIRHNIFAYGTKSQIHRHKKDLKTARERNFVSFYFEHNIVYWQSGKLLSGMSKDYQSHTVFDNNIYWQLDKSDFKLGNLSWREWQKSDRHSQIIDPLYVAPEIGNFKLQTGSPALYWQTRKSKFQQD